jgi:protein-S-isoprenylcysteine O-methyltransferase Ste14
MKLLLALAAIMLWPVIPLFWIPVHLMPGVLKRVGRTTYLLALILWMPFAYVIFKHRGLVFDYIVEIPRLLSFAGLLILTAGSTLHIWTGALLSPRGLIGIPEIITPEKSVLIDKGPFAVVRHPTYLAHTMMFLGVFLFTGVIATGLLTLVDCVVVSIFIIPLEERELLRRFGESYLKYQKKVPQLLPRLRGKR